MNGLFVFAIILLAGAILVTALGFGLRSVGKKEDDDDFRLGAGVAFAIAGILALGFGLSTIFASFNAVGTYDIGVTTSFGRVLSYVGPGPHWIAPWENMSLMDESVQQTDYRLTVRVAGQQTAQADVRLRWQLVPAATDSLFRQYKGNTANVETALVKPETNVAMNSVYDGYDPILPLSTHAKPGTPDNPSTSQLSQQVAGALAARIGHQVTIKTLVVQPLVYDATVERRINSVLAQTAKTDVAQQSEQTAAAQARANEIIQSSISHNPLVLVQQCMNAIADGQLNPPAGFSCWPGQGSGVVIPSAK